MKFTIHNKTTAPEASQPILQAVERAYGFIPNLYGVFAESPAAVQAYVALSEALKKSALSPIEQQVVAIAVSTENDCAYCVAAHSGMASMMKMPDATLCELREQRPLSDPKLKVLRDFTLAVVKERGWVAPTEVEAFLGAGYSRRQLLEVITVVAMKTLSNYVNHIAETPLDQAFESKQWSAKKEHQTA
ncbi:MAG: carboxymuconolactone decarboxylase family protein [Acidobacteriota bacterium]